MIDTHPIHFVFLIVSGTLYGCEAPKDWYVISEVRGEAERLRRYDYKCQTQIEVTLHAMPMKNVNFTP